MKQKSVTPKIPSDPSNSYRPKLPRRLLAAAAIALAPATVLDTAESAVAARQEQAAHSAEVSAEIAQAKEHFRVLAGDVDIFAHRFDSCKLVGQPRVEEKAGTTPSRSGEVMRDKVVLSLDAHQTAASKQLEAQYPDAENGPIRRNSGFFAYAVEHGVDVMQSELPRPAEVENGLNSLTLYPKTDYYVAGNTITIFAAVTAEADTLVGSYRENGRIYCGTLERTADEQGHLTWTVAPDAPQLEDTYSVEGIIPPAPK